MADDLQQKMAKTFWKRPEGTTGKILLGAAIIAGAGLTWVYLPIILAWLTLVLANTITAIALGAVLVAITSPIWSSKVRTLTGYALRSFLRGITKFFVEIDPIGILKNYVEDLRKNLSGMDQQLELLNGSIKRLQGIIVKNKKDADKSLALAGVANKQGKQAAFSLNARRQGRLEGSNMTLNALLKKMESLFALLLKLRETSDFMVQDMSDEVVVKEQERNALLAGYGAFTSAMKVLKGDPDKRALYDQAMEFLAEDYAKKIGEIEMFMTTSQGFIQSVDLDNGIFEQDALDKLSAQMDSFTTRLDNKFRVDDAPAAPALAEPLPLAEGDEVDDLFNQVSKK